MKKKDLVSLINNFTVNHSKYVAEIFFILKDEKTSGILKRADIESEAQIKLKEEFTQSLNERIVLNEDLSVIPISNIDERKNVLFKYDLDELPKGLDFLEQLERKEDYPLFSFKNDRLEDITGIIFLIHFENDTLISYKRNFPINLYKKDTKGVPLIRFGDNNRFKEVDEDILKIYPDFDLFKLNSDLFIRNINVLEKFFSFHEVIKATAKKTLTDIESANIIENIETLEEMVEDISFARKLTKVGSHSPVLKKIPANTIIKFVTTYPSLKGKFELNEDKSRIKLTTKVSKKTFLKLLNDDFLQSQLTQLHYDSLAKETVEL